MRIGQPQPTASASAGPDAFDSSRSAGRRRFWWVGAARFAIAAGLFGIAAGIWGPVAGHSGRPGVPILLVVTGLVAAVLSRLREPINRWADRRAGGREVLRHQEFRELLGRMGRTLPVDEVVPRLAEIIGRGAHGSRAEIRLQLADGPALSQVWPPDAAPGQNPLTVQIRHLGDEIAEVQVDADGGPESRTDRRMLDQLAAPAGPALATVRLTYALRHRRRQLEELEASLLASGRRLLLTRQQEQERLRAAVESRVTPHLAAASWCVSQAAADPGQLDQLGTATVELTDALDALRVLARGIYPARLTEAGVEVSVRTYVEQSGLNAVISTAGTVAGPSIPPELQSCVYFCIVTLLEAVQADNATRLDVHLAGTDTALDFDIVIGTPTDIDSAAEYAVRDRLEAFNGTFRVNGTNPVRLAGSVPLRTSVLEGSA